MRSKSKKVIKPEGVGPLLNCPLALQLAVCVKCGRQVSLINSGMNCSCHKKTHMGNMKLLVNGEKMDSRSEAIRYSKLLYLLAKNLITNLKVHPKYTLAVNGTKVCTYELDFEYTYQGANISEDVKGHATLHFRIKWKLFGALFPEKNLVIVKA